MVDTSVSRVECPAAREPVVKTLIVALMVFGFGVYCAYHAWIGKYEGANHLFNLVCGIILPPAGLIIGAYGFLMSRRRFVADAEGLGWAGKEKIAWGRVNRLVVRGKELFDVHYTDGGKGVIKLDAYKMQNFVELVRLIEASTPGVPTETAK